MKKEFIKKWLKEHQYCVIATSHENKPWAATVNYTIGENFNIYISARSDSLKFKNLSKNPNVCLVVDSQTREGTLQIQGIAEILELKEEGTPNIRVRPTFLIFKSKDESGKANVLELKL